MKVLFDTNVVLDVLLDRAPFVALSARLVSEVEEKAIQGYLCATTLTTIDYLIAKSHDHNTAQSALTKLLGLFQVCSVNAQVLQLALNSPFNDFEDAVQFYSGVCEGVDAIVTRNIKDYKAKDLPVYTPAEMWGLIQLEKR